VVDVVEDIAEAHLGTTHTGEAEMAAVEVAMVAVVEEAMEVAVVEAAMGVVAAAVTNMESLVAMEEVAAAAAAGVLCSLVSQSVDYF